MSPSDLRREATTQPLDKPSLPISGATHVILDAFDPFPSDEAHLSAHRVHFRTSHRGLHDIFTADGLKVAISSCKGAVFSASRRPNRLVPFI